VIRDAVRYGDDPWRDGLFLVAFLDKGGGPCVPSRAIDDAACCLVVESLVNRSCDLFDEDGGDDLHVLEAVAGAEDQAVSGR
jgi:hypothetical protein